MRPRLLDLYGGAGGAAQGYVDVGFLVTSVDMVRRRHLPDDDRIEFVRGDALDWLGDVLALREFDAIHASPPCQTHTRAKHLRDAQGKSTDKVDLIAETKWGLERAGVPYVIENVPGSPLRKDLLLCGSMFPELYVHDETGRRWLQRHRIFESNVPLGPQPECRHKEAGVRPLGVYASKADNIPGGGQTARTLEEGRALMGIPWMSWAALIEALPPTYTRHLGLYLLDAIAQPGQVVGATGEA